MLLHTMMLCVGNNGDIMSLTDKLRFMLFEIEEHEEELKNMSSEWEDGDLESAACSDPSDQYMLGEQIETLWKEFKETVNEEVH